MNERGMKLLAALGIALAIALPVGLSTFLARYQGLEQEANLALRFAREVLSRSESTAVELDTGLDILAAKAVGDACSPGNIELMRQLDISSVTLQAIGVVERNQLLCLSLSGLQRPIDLGPPDIVQPSGVKIWTHVELPFAKGKQFLVIARGNYAGIVHKDYAIAVSDAEPGLSVAVLSFPRRAVLSARGLVKPEWLAALHGGYHTNFRDSDRIVAVVASRRYALAAVAALPEAEVDRRAWKIARVTLPFGLLMGGLLAWAVFLLARMQQALPAVLKGALKRKELFMVYQPVVDLRTGRWIGAEALIRWERPQGESVRPDVFIVAAEDSGLIRQVTKDVVLQQVCKDAETLFRHHPDFHIAINLAAEDMQSERTIQMLRELIEATGARRGNLMVEATERSFAHPGTVRNIVAALRAIGIRIAIDDFGTGYSSLSFLESVDFDLLKIDKSFVDTLDTNSPTSQVIHHIIEMAKALNLEMIAEGVETEAQAQFLRARGVHYAQGWLFARPMAFDVMLETLTRARAEEARREVPSER
jgi:sensor c-di-GMP phosphodiesterase-like protein